MSTFSYILRAEKERKSVKEKEKVKKREGKRKLERKKKKTVSPSCSIPREKDIKTRDIEANRDGVKKKKKI